MKSESNENKNNKSNDVAIRVTNLSKKFRNYEEKESTLKSTIINLLKKRKLTKNEFWALKDINFEIKRGETFGIVGSNGSGKSTLLKILAGIIYPTEGEIQVDGRISTLFELGTGFHPELSGRDNIFLNGTILGLSRKEVEEKYDSIVEFSELKEFIDMPLKHYSSGMQMRLAFAVAISVNPDILLIDEVLAVGDAEFQAKSYAAFQEIKKKGATIIFVTHDLNATRINCDRVLLIQKSKQIAIGKPSEIITKYQHLVEDSQQIKNQITDDNNTDNNKENDRFGDGKAIIEKAWVEDEKGKKIQAISSKNINIKVASNFLTKSEHPVFGIIITNQEGKQVFASNNLWKNIPAGPYKSGDTVVSTYKLPNVFEHGHYQLTAGISYSGTGKYYDFRDKFMTFLIQKPYLTGSVTNPDHELTIEKLK